MDDAIAPNFPGVVEGIIHFLTEQHTFCAIAIGFNKMILTRCNAADLYTSEFDKADQRLDYGLGYPFHYKTLPFINHPLRIFHIPSFVNPDSIGVKLRKRYQHSEWAKQPWIQAMVSGLKKIIR